MIYFYIFDKSKTKMSNKKRTIQFLDDLENKKNNDVIKKKQITCWACQCDEPILNQLAHCDPGGCLYESSDDDDISVQPTESIKKKDVDKSRNINDTDSEKCWGCVNDEPNQEAHQLKGGCEYDDNYEN